MALGTFFPHTDRVMNLLSIPLLAVFNVEPAIQVLALFFIGWALVMFLVLHIDGNRTR